MYIRATAENTQQNFLYSIFKKVLIFSTSLCFRFFFAATSFDIPTVYSIQVHKFSIVILEKKNFEALENFYN